MADDSLPVADGTCKTCRFFEFDPIDHAERWKMLGANGIEPPAFFIARGLTHGWCRRRPPTKNHPQYPDTYQSEWCGQYREGPRP